MKKMAKKIGAATMIVLLSSCSTNYDKEFETTTKDSTFCNNNYILLQNEVNSLNSQIASSETRGFLSRLFKRVLNVFVSDCIGAVKGGFQGENIWLSAQGASLNSAKKQGFITIVDATNTYITRSTSIEDDVLVTTLLQPKESALDKLILAEDPINATISDSIGYYHNMIIYETLEKSNSTIYWAEVSDYASLLQLNSEIIEIIPTTTYNDTIVNYETLEFCSFISDESLKCDNYQELIDVTKIKYPQLNDMLNIVSSYFQGMELVTTEEEWEMYCKNLIEIISKSDIPTNDKESLKMGITVGFASSKLWKYE